MNEKEIKARHMILAGDDLGDIAKELNIAYPKVKEIEAKIHLNTITVVPNDEEPLEDNDPLDTLRTDISPENLDQDFIDAFSTALHKGKKMLNDKDLTPLEFGKIVDTISNAYKTINPEALPTGKGKKEKNGSLASFKEGMK